MSLTIHAEPFLFGWAKNRNSLLLRTNGVQQSAGWKAVYTWQFGGVMASGHHIVFVLDGRELVFTVKPIGGSAAYEVRDTSQLKSKLASNYYIRQVFESTINGDSLTLKAIKVGKHAVEIYTTNSQGQRNGYESSLIVSQSINNGGERTDLPNYAVVAMVETEVNDYNVVKTYDGEPMVLQPDSDGYVDVPMDVVRGLVPQPDLPTAINTPWQLLTNALLRYRISYGEMWGSPTPMVQNMVQTGWYYALCGEMVERYAAVNLPDWKSGQNYQLGRADLFWIVGENTGESRIVRSGQPVYIYGLFYNSRQDIGNVMEDYPVSVLLQGVDENGNEISQEASYKPVNGQVYRMNVAPVLLGRHILSYKVSVSNASGVWTRTYHVKPNLYRQTIFLLQDRYGLLKVAVCGQVSRELTTEGEVLTVDQRRYIDVTEHADTYTAVFGLMNEREAKEIGRAVANRYHYIRLNERWERITIEPGTFSMSDGAENMAEVQFQFRFVDNQQENMANGPMERTITTNIFDRTDAVVSYIEVSAANENILWQR